jgi:hypothetical protein
LPSRFGFLILDPPPDCAQPPVVSAVDLNRLGECEKPKVFSIQQAPNVHLAAIAEQLAQLSAGDQAFIAGLRSGRPPRGLSFRIWLKYFVCSPTQLGAQCAQVMES